MATRPFFCIGDGKLSFYKEQYIEFDFFTGFAKTQKVKSIRSMHEAIHTKFNTANILEVSRKSEDILGTKLSAFNLKLNHSGKLVSVENIFQSSKVFQRGGPYLDLLSVSPVEAKKDDRLKNSGPMIYFSLNGEKWDLEPKTMFYDHLYLTALNESSYLKDELLQFDTFTDIEFNPKKSFNCQARSVAIFVTLVKHNKLIEYLEDLSLFKSIYGNSTDEPFQLT